MRSRTLPPPRLHLKFNSEKMSRINLQKEFLNLRLQGFSLSKIAEALGISIVTAKRWNKALSANISRDDESTALRKKIIEKQKEYFEFLDLTFISLKSEIQKYDAPRMPYDKLIVSAMKILSAINKMSPVRPSFSDNLINSIAGSEEEQDIDDGADSLNDTADDTADDTAGIISQTSENQNVTLKKY